MLTSSAEINSGGGSGFVTALLDEQARMTAVQRFSWDQRTGGSPAREPHYRSLIPLSEPGPGEQYAFDVDLGACTGCKACVTACHGLNGLEEEEAWRDVGLLVGGPGDAPVLQHVTTACHHCLEPACLAGCPVLAYEKDARTGIVWHLDDQCIGCQYCILKCPYDVPKYSRAKGIVRKCDMCRHRLAVGEPPACVQACPNRAIRIRLATALEVVEESESHQFLPGAPDPGYTLPTTAYRRGAPFPRNMLPADYYAARPAQPHSPLAVMLVFTQMSVGAFLAGGTFGNTGRRFSLDPTAGEATGDPVSQAAALLLGLLGLGAALFHLGRPHLAYRAVLGLRQSWLSREILAFGVFAVAAAASVLLSWLAPAPTSGTAGLARGLQGLSALAGIAGVFASAMIYADTRRPLWSAPSVLVKFALTCIVLGIPLSLVIALLGAAWSSAEGVRDVMLDHGRDSCRLLVLAAAAKLGFEALIFKDLRAWRNTPHKRAALLMVGELGTVTVQRFVCGMLGGVVLPVVLANEAALSAGVGYAPLFTSIASVLALALLTAGELLERRLFFATSVAPKMPGPAAS